MDQRQENQWEAGERRTEPDPGAAPNRLTWPFKRLYWSLEDRILWPIADAFRRKGNPRRQRSPVAYVGVTLLIAIAGGATAAAVYFHNQANGDPDAAAVAQAPAEPGTSVAPATGPGTTQNNPAGEVARTPDDETLQGVVPSFEKSAGQSGNGSGSGSASGGSGSGSKTGNNSSQGKGKKKRVLVKPASPPRAPPLRVAYRFAQTFTGYEVGRKGAAKMFAATATPKLAKDLRRNPPKLPADGEVPRATVMNVVKGQKEGRRLLVSVALLRSGATSELRLVLKKAKGKKKNRPWRVSEVRG